MEDGELALQAASSIEHKRFHAQGGSVYALYPGTPLSPSVKLIVSLQTISDYLDNLCDRMGTQEEAALRQLHLAVLEAVDPRGGLSDYYRLYPHKGDHFYLNRLVQKCREQVEGIPAYSAVMGCIKKYAGLYSDLQVYKHLPQEVREDRMRNWAGRFAQEYPEISLWEFSAASGSTLGMFAMAAAAFNPSLTPQDVKELDSAYFPWICGLHILLDYYIDLQEDLQHGDLNFVQYYKNMDECEERLSFFINRSFAACCRLNFPDFHRTVVMGLLAMYLSDAKALKEFNRAATLRLLGRGGGNTRLYFRLCRMLRSLGKL
jgi:tetraprenyl-beta-curcumene synthase